MYVVSTHYLLQLLSWLDERTSLVPIFLDHLRHLIVGVSVPNRAPLLQCHFRRFLESAKDEERSVLSASLGSFLVRLAHSGILRMVCRVLFCLQTKTHQDKATQRFVVDSLPFMSMTLFREVVALFLGYNKVLEGKTSSLHLIDFSHEAPSTFGTTTKRLCWTQRRPTRLAYDVY
jgi:hypothetical protein